MYVFMCVYVYIYIYIYCTHLYLYIYIHTHITPGAGRWREAVIGLRTCTNDMHVCV